MYMETFIVLLPYLFEGSLAYDDTRYFRILVNCEFFVLFFACIPRNTFIFNEIPFGPTEFCFLFFNFTGIYSYLYCFLPCICIYFLVFICFSEGET